MNIEIVKNLDDYMKVMVIRGVVFMGEQNHKYNTEFDGNEMNNRVHLLAMEDNEPVASLRIFKEDESAKLERILVLKEYRGKGVAGKLMNYAYDYCRQENIKNIYLFCKPELENYWSQKGYEKVAGDKVLHYKDLELVPIMKRLDVSSEKPISKQAANDELPTIFKHEKGTWVSRSNSGNKGNSVSGKAGNEGR